MTKAPPLSRQAPLFSRDRVVERTVSTGTVIRTRLQPLEDGRVTILEYYRKTEGGQWIRRHQEERKVSFASLGLNCSFDELFGPA